MTLEEAAASLLVHSSAS